MSDAAFPIRIRRFRIAALVPLAAASGSAQASDPTALLYFLPYAVAVPLLFLALGITIVSRRQPGLMAWIWGPTLALLLTPLYVRHFDDLLGVVPFVILACSVAVYMLVHLFLAAPEESGASQAGQESVDAAESPTPSHPATSRADTSDS